MSKKTKKLKKKIKTLQNQLEQLKTPSKKARRKTFGNAFFPTTALDVSTDLAFAKVAWPTTEERSAFANLVLPSIGSAVTDTDANKSTSF